MTALLITGWKAFVICAFALLGLGFFVFGSLYWAVGGFEKEVLNERD